MNDQRKQIALHTPSNLHQYLDEFFGTDDPDAQKPIEQYGPFANIADLIGSFMLYCSACGYLNEE